MATSLTYDSLIISLQAYLERGAVTDPTVYAQLPYLVNQAERAIADRFKILGFLTPMLGVGGLIAGQSVYNKPDRWRRTASMRYATVWASDPLNQNYSVQLFPRGLEYCQSYWPDASFTDPTNPPKFYADYDYSHWLIVPTPDQAYPWSINAYLLPPLLGPTQQTNWTTEYAPNLILYRALLECTPFLKNDERIQTWEKMYEEYAQSIDAQDLKRIVDRSAVRNED